MPGLMKQPKQEPPCARIVSLREAHGSSIQAAKMVAQFCTRVAARIGSITGPDAQAVVLGRAIGTIEGGLGPPRPHSGFGPAVA
eukprot:3845058-Pyramimonas_sp.AAC.1